MIEHPGAELQVLIKEKGLTQKAFASILGKKVSEVNELLKGKRNITIQRDYLLHQTLGTPIKYWILKQVDYDYSLLDIEEQKSPPSVRGEAPKELGGFSDHTSHSEQSEESKKTGNQMDSSVDSLPQNDNNDVILNDSEVYSSSGESTEHHIRHSEPEARSASEGRENPSNTTPMDFSLQSKGQTNTQDSSSSLNSSSEGQDSQIVPPFQRGISEGQGDSSETNTQQPPIQEPAPKDDEDFKNRARIFKSF